MSSATRRAPRRSPTNCAPSCRSSAPSMASPERRREGFALIGVLWLLLLLGIIAGVLLAEARSERHQAATAAARLQARLIADAAINRALLSLVNAQDPEHWRLDGTPRRLPLFGHNIAV